MRLSRPRFALPLLLLALAAGCSKAEGANAAEGTPEQTGQVGAANLGPDPYQDFPLYGRVSGTAITVRKEAAPEGIALGWLRRGEIIRLKPSTLKSATCKSGWHEIHPKGFVCAGEGIDVSPGAPQVAEEDRSEANRNAPMPYQYYLVKDAKVPEYHQLPSRDQQRAAAAYSDMWQKLELEGNAQKLKKFLEGSLPGQPTKHAVIRRFLERGFYVASTGTLVRSQRTFARSVRGSYIKAQQLEPKSGPSFHGVELKDGKTLPAVWAVRGATPQVPKTRADGSVNWVDAPDAKPFERLSVVSNWKGWARVDGKLMHELSDGTYLYDWYLAVAEKMARPKEVGPKEPWVHVDVGEQTLVLYVGDEPIYATLISSGLVEHATPLGSFRIHKKYVSDSMADIGADVADNRYSIDDVPWTQYFDGARALHGAFWHSQFGIKRSHGCVNLAPADAFYIFQHTWPVVAPGWHGVSTQKTGYTGSLVVITE
ncbi:MAG: L,D-transpeptidase [Myxococcales bacterium]